MALRRGVAAGARPGGRLLRGGSLPGTVAATLAVSRAEPLQAPCDDPKSIRRCWPVSRVPLQSPEPAGALQSRRCRAADGSDQAPQSGWERGDVAQSGPCP